MSTVRHLAEEVSSGLRAVLPGINKNPLYKLSLCAAAVLEVQSCNTMDIAAVLPLETERIDMRYQWLSRFLSTDSIDNDEVMRPFIRQALETASASGETLILCIDQTQLSDRFGILSLSLRFGGRALPLLWRVRKGQGNIGSDICMELLEKIKSFLPEGSRVLLLGDRFYGQAPLIAFCHRSGWDYRLRLKENLKVFNEAGDETSLADLVPAEKKGRKELLMKNIYLTEQRVQTNLSILQEPGHDEPWLLAVGGTEPNYYKTLDYGMRWGCEAMFSDFKTRGFGLEDTKLERADRIARLMLILSVAMHWCVLAGLRDRMRNPLPREKKLKISDLTTLPTRMRNSMSCRQSSEKLGEVSVLISKEDSGCSEDTLRCSVPCLPCFLHCEKVMDGKSLSTYPISAEYTPFLN